MKLVAITILSALMTLFGLVRLVFGVETLAFDPSSTANVGYVLYWGTNDLHRLGSMPLDTNRVVSLTGGPWGALYFKVTAWTSNGVESLPSNVVLATNRPAAPLRLRVVSGTNSLTLEGSDELATWRTLAVIPRNAPPVTLSAQPRQVFRLRAPPLPQ